ncbi:hypothetical protein HETIRDRAFT_440271 [Heterobasidion irregulare TC 32-1]|uniref:Uncharacterized protein n=1 Tax=Heterobasidion irregulare (strain TC 32-1) TaxID=747525 RepID=W4K5E3_HETIT|nr:uncharacterized protein HETIRDRAFT_440271 [Heterobasidion irregulare TC 32-1]ETW80256.1 hypothetical protein HETIRDRAFT_440271 [Heterobasidion irregulare TC 32-1]
MPNCIQFSLVVHLPSISSFLPVLLFLVSLFFIVQRTIRSPKVEEGPVIIAAPISPIKTPIKQEEGPNVAALVLPTEMSHYTSHGASEELKGLWNNGDGVSHLLLSRTSSSDDSSTSDQTEDVAGSSSAVDPHTDLSRYPETVPSRRRFTLSILQPMERSIFSGDVWKDHTFSPYESPTRHGPPAAITSHDLVKIDASEDWQVLA